MNIPEGYYFTENHEWIKKENGVAVIGISEYAVEELGDIVFVELPDIESEFNQGAGFAVLESVKAVSDIFTPVSGLIIDVNKKLLEEPGLINESPYDEGWLAKIKLSDIEEIGQLMDHIDYDTYIEEIE
ncbi:MAG: glycine cleavage system protein GcvH [Bacillota bacterium]